MLSFNDGWKFSTRGLSAICKEGPDAILSALRELEKTGYLVRHQERNANGKMGSMVFEIYEEPQEVLPDTEKPHTENPDTVNPVTEQPYTDTIDHMEVDGHTFWLMEHDTFGDEAPCVIVDEKGKLAISDVYDGFDEHTVHLLEMEVLPVDRMPDETISVDEMKEYGYAWGGMLPMREEAAAEIGKGHTIYRLYGDNTEGMVMDMSEIREHAAQGGIFGIEKAEWIASLERSNPLKSAEMSTEDDYGMIDGIINNGAKEEKAA